MPLHVAPLIDKRLIDIATDYLQTLDPAYFPFAANFDAEKQAAFVRDLRIGLRRRRRQRGFRLRLLLRRRRRHDHQLLLLNG